MHSPAIIITPPVITIRVSLEGTGKGSQLVMLSASASNNRGILPLPSAHVILQIHGIIL